MENEEKVDYYDKTLTEKILQAIPKFGIERTRGVEVKNADRTYDFRPMGKGLAIRDVTEGRLENGKGTALFVWDDSYLHFCDARNAPEGKLFTRPEPTQKNLQDYLDAIEFGEIERVFHP